MLIKVKAWPEEKENQVIQKSADSFEVKTKLKPIQGQANQAVRRLLAEHFKIDLEKVRIVKGFKQRNKIFEIKI